MRASHSLRMVWLLAFVFILARCVMSLTTPLKFSSSTVSVFWVNHNLRHDCRMESSKFDLRYRTTAAAIGSTIGTNFEHQPTAVGEGVAYPVLLRSFDRSRDSLWV